MVNKRAGHEEAAELARGRSNLYRLLARVFGNEPTRDLLRQIKTQGFMACLSEIGLSFQCRLLEDPEDEVVRALTVEYARLFIGPGRHISPHESVQRGERQLWGEPTVEVSKYYMRCGFSLDKEFKGIPDHIAVEFELVARLAEEEANKWKKGDYREALKFQRLQAEFLDDHMKRWIPSFCDKVMESTESPFYAVFANLAKIVVLSDIERGPSRHLE